MMAALYRSILKEIKRTSFPEPVKKKLKFNARVAFLLRRQEAQQEAIWRKEGYEILEFLRVLASQEKETIDLLCRKGKKRF